MSSYKVFICCQQTEAVKNLVTSLEHSHRSLDIRLSSPPFNGKALLSKGRAYNLPCYGIRISRAICDLFNRTTLSIIFDCLPPKTLDWGLNTYVQKHANSIHLDPLFKINSKATEQIRRFLNAFSQLEDKDVSCFEDWNRFLLSHGIDKDWENNLHVDKVLQNFGFTDEETKKVQEHQNTLRWLSKCLTGYNLKGCLTDMVNLIYALTNSDTDNQTEKDIVDKINSFQKRDESDENNKKIFCFIQRPVQLKTDNLWIPNAIIHDCEFDDVLALTMCHRLNPRIHEYVQLPLSRSSVLYDKDSKNGDNLYEPYLSKIYC